MEGDEPVPVTTVSDEIEAEVVCGLLRSAGIECGHRHTDDIDTPLEDFGSAGRHVVLVHARDLEAAKSLLEGAEPAGDSDS